MKYYSEKLNELFDTPEALAEAEATAKKKSSKKTKVEEVVPEEPCTPTKKQLAAEVDAADNAVKEAYANYESAKVKAEELSKKYLAEVAAIMDPAKKAVKDAEQRRYDAIKNFNDSYGAYQVTYTGSKAAEEFIKAISNMKRDSSFYKDLFWF